MIKRTLVIGDIHGGFRALQQVFLRAKISPLDTLIFLGDYVDGWSESPQVIDFLIDLQKTNTCIFLKGNHDELLLDKIDQLDNPEIDNSQWYRHGGEATVMAYKNISPNKIAAHKQFLAALQNYYLDNENRLFLHAGFTNLKGVAYEYFPKMLYWERTLWESAVSLDKNLAKDNPRYPARFKIYNEIYIGHTPTTHIGVETPAQFACVWNIDTGAAFKGKLSVMDIETKEFWQSDSLPDLYPNEKGRN